jgi:hypothetical protein
MLRFRTIISCDACADDEAFASAYPESFGDNLYDIDHRSFRFDNSRILNAGLVLDTIDRKLSSAVPGIGRIGEFTIFVEQSSTSRRMRSLLYNQEMVRTLAMVKISFLLQRHICAYLLCILFHQIRVEMTSIVRRFSFQKATTMTTTTKKNAVQQSVPFLMAKNTAVKHAVLKTVTRTLKVFLPVASSSTVMKVVKMQFANWIVVRAQSKAMAVTTGTDKNIPPPVRSSLAKKGDEHDPHPEVALIPSLVSLKQHLHHRHTTVINMDVDELEELEILVSVAMTTNSVSLL